MFRALRTSVLLLLASLSAPAFADGQLWLATETKGEIAKGVLLMADANFRLHNSASHVGQIQLRWFLGHDFGPVTLATGYSYVYTSRVGGRQRHEHRISQQMDFDILDSPGLKLAGRTRLEQRLYTDDSGVSIRARQRIKATVPLGDEGYALIGTAELFAALNDGPSGAEEGDVQTRFFGGFLVPFTRNVGLEIGYLNQHDWQRQLTTNDIFSLNVVTKF